MDGLPYSQVTTPVITPPAATPQELSTTKPFEEKDWAFNFYRPENMRYEKIVKELENFNDYKSWKTLRGESIDESLLNDINLQMNKLKKGKRKN